MRMLCIIALTILCIVEVGPVPVTPILLLYVVLSRPAWFYELIVKIYDKD
jgi:hypothetical protein